jgi:hypothetical protein
MLLLRSYLREAVIDASDRFSRKRSADLAAKIAGVVDEVPATLAQQDSQEEVVNKELILLQAIPDGLMNQKRMRLAAPLAFGEEGWGPNEGILSVIASTYPGDPAWNELTRFVQGNAAAFEESIQLLTQGLVDISDRANNMHWPASWQRYTDWGSVSSTVMRFKSNVARMLKGR